MHIPASLALTNNSPVETLGFEIRIDQQTVYDGTIPAGKSVINFEIPEDEAEHTLTFTLKGKESSHTKIDSEGNILSDVLIEISDVEFDGINIDRILFDLATYSHNYNGTSADITETYMAVLGCNGDVKLSFSSPVYLWILENS